MKRSLAITLMAVLLFAAAVWAEPATVEEPAASTGAQQAEPEIILPEAEQMEQPPADTPEPAINQQTLPVYTGSGYLQPGEKLFPAEDVNLRKDSDPSKNYNEKTALVQGDINGEFANPSAWQRLYFLKFDLSSLDPSRLLDKVTFTFTNAAGGWGGVVYGIYYSEDNSWSEQTASYASTVQGKDYYAGFLHDKNAGNCVSVPAASNGAAQTVDISKILQDIEEKENKVFTLIMRDNSGLATNSAGRIIHTKEADSEANLPFLQITYQEDFSGFDPLPQGEKIYPSEATGISSHPDDKDKNLSQNDVVAISGTYVTGYMRHYYMKFDLRGAQRRIKKAELSVYSQNIQSTIFGVFGSTMDDWDASVMTYNSADKSFLSNRDDCLAQVEGLTGGLPAVFDVTDFVQAQVDSDRIVTLALRDINTTAGYNPFSNFYTTKAAENVRPYLKIEYFDQNEKLGVSNISFTKNGSKLDQAEPGSVKTELKIANNLFEGGDETVTAIFAKCKGTAKSYRVTDSAVDVKTVKAKRPASLSHTFTLEEGEFIKVFFWDSEAAQQVIIRHITFDNEGLKQ